MRRPPRVDQFSPAVAPADGVTQGILLTRRLLHELGFASEIFANHIAPELRHEVRHVDDYAPAADDVLLYHHAIGHLHHDRLMRLPCRRVLVYHNVTPSHFFPADPFLQDACDWGRRQIATAAHRFVGAYADSDYNRLELAAMGYRNVAVLPLLFEFAPDAQPAVRPLRQPLRLLFVGRQVSNKCQHHLIYTLFYLRRELGIDATLTLVGGVSQPGYGDFLRDLVSALDLSDAVVLAGRVEAATLQSHYDEAHLFISLSEHEGFCIPLLEAVRSGVPALAYAAGGVPDTIGGHGLLHQKSAASVAGVIAHHWANPDARAALHHAQWSFIQGFRRDRLKRRLSAFLDALPVPEPL